MISGRVQGVFFRSELRRAAVRQRVTGWVRNRHDGRVEAVLEGDEVAVNQVLAFCRQGPLLAQVSGVQVTWATYRGAFGNFRIRSTS
jgi:acylphosphatase